MSVCSDLCHARFLQRLFQRISHHFVWRGNSWCRPWFGPPSRTAAQKHKGTSSKKESGLTVRVKNYAASYFVLGKLLHFLRSKGVASVSPLVEVLGEVALQLQAATFIQIVHAGQNVAKSNAATSSNQSEVNCFSPPKKRFLHKINYSHLLKASKQVVSW